MIKKDNFVLSVVIPVYNEKETIEEIINRVIYAPYQKEIIVVDDGSTDGTRTILNGLNNPVVKIHYHDKNCGKGRAARVACVKGAVAPSFAATRQIDTMMR